MKTSIVDLFLNIKPFTVSSNNNTALKKLENDDKGISNFINNEFIALRMQANIDDDKGLYKDSNNMLKDNIKNAVIKGKYGKNKGIVKDIRKYIETGSFINSIEVKNG